VRLVDVPAGSTLFIDTNIFIYHLAGTYASCAILLDRARRHEVRLITSVSILQETYHRLMIAEAAQRFGRHGRPLADWLKRHPELIRTLIQRKRLGELIQACHIRVLPIASRLMRDASAIIDEYGLLTTDALLVATMRTHHLTHLASNDRDFARVPGLTVWRP
jgi:predicted nucleic acid-binding protein